MRIAIILQNLPFPISHGLNLRVYNIVKRLATRFEIKVFVLNKGNPAIGSDLDVEIETIESDACRSKLQSVKGARKLPRGARFYGTDMGKLTELEGKLRNHHADLVFGMGFDILSYLGLMKVDVPKVIDFVDSWVLFNWRQLRKERLSLLNVTHLVASLSVTMRYAKSVRAITTVSEVDSENIRNITLGRRVDTVPNGVDLVYYNALNYEGTNANQIVFSGSMQWPPNRDGVAWFLEECWRKILGNIPEANLLIIGKDLDDQFKAYLESFEHVQALGYVDDIRKYIWPAQVSIAPMISGSGIKNKILESWALGIPVVATALGAKGLICQDQKNIVIAEDAESFSRSIEELLENRDRRIAIGGSGRKNVEEYYSWDIAVDKLSVIFREALKA